MITDTQPTTCTAEHREGPCSDIIKDLAAIQLKHTTVSYTLISKDLKGVNYSQSFYFEKPSIAAKKINTFMQDPTSLTHDLDQNQPSDR